jgi:hypothetical protein
MSLRRRQPVQYGLCLTTMTMVMSVVMIMFLLHVGAKVTRQPMLMFLAPLIQSFSVPTDMWLTIWNTGPRSRQGNKCRIQETMQGLPHRLNAMQNVIPKDGISNCRSAVQLVDCVANDRLLKYKCQHFFLTDERRLSSKSLTRQCS